MAVGKVSLDDCDMFTSSLGWTGTLEPITPPASSIARLEITSLAFMLVWVPLPVCQIWSGNSIVELARRHLVGRLLDQGGQVRRQLAEITVDLGRRSLQDPKSPDEGLRHRFAPDVEVVQRALRLRAPVPVRGDLDLPHAVALYPSVFHVAAAYGRRLRPSRRDGTKVAHVRICSILTRSPDPERKHHMADILSTKARELIARRYWLH